MDRPAARAPPEPIAVDPTPAAGAPGRSPVRVVDSHTEGEPTRVVVAGGPDLGRGPITARRDRLRAEHARWCHGLVSEPRAAPGTVGALLGPPEAPDHAGSAIYFDRAGFLGMCGHGTIGLVTTLAFLGRVAPGPAILDTPVGAVETELRPDGRVRLSNVRSYRARARVPVEVPDVGTVVGDVAWGGNWFFIVDGAPAELRLAHVEALTSYCRAIRLALARAGITGEAGMPIEHIQLTGPPERSENDARNFVLTPDGTYDRSPCGTGTSARVACLFADGRLRPGQVWRQEGILGGVFEAVAEPLADGIRPQITGRAHVTGVADLLFDADDPLRDGVAP